MCTGNNVTPKLRGQCQGSCSGATAPGKPELSPEKQHESCHREEGARTAEAASGTDRAGS